MTAAVHHPLGDKFEFLSPRASADCPAFDCPPDKLLEVVAWLRDELAYPLLVDVTAIDGRDRTPRFTTVYHFYSLREHVYLRLAVDCADDDEPAVPSLCGLYPGANWHERETYDMFGIRFAGHPDLRRILMWDEYPHFPLRKEFPLAGRQTVLPDEEVVEATGAKVEPAPMMGGPFVTREAGPMSQAEPRAGDESWTEAQEKPVAADGGGGN